MKNIFVALALFISSTTFAGGGAGPAPITGGGSNIVNSSYTPQLISDLSQMDDYTQKQTDRIMHLLSEAQKASSFTNAQKNQMRATALVIANEMILSISPIMDSITINAFTAIRDAVQPLITIGHAPSVAGLATPAVQNLIESMNNINTESVPLMKELANLVSSMETLAKQFSEAQEGMNPQLPIAAQEMFSATRMMSASLSQTTGFFQRSAAVIQESGSAIQTGSFSTQNSARLLEIHAEATRQLGPQSTVSLRPATLTLERSLQRLIAAETILKP